MTGGLQAAGARLERVATFLTVAMAVAFLGVLGFEARSAVFFADECFHAHVARWIAAHGRLPAALPEFYSGLTYAYPPAFHLLAGGVVALLGEGALRWLNLALTALVLLVLAVGPPRDVPVAARRWAVLLVVGNAAVATYALRFYVEAWLALLVAGSAVFLLRLATSGRRGDAVGLGLAIGLALASKASALALLAVPLGAATLWAARGDRLRAGRAALALVVAILVASPVLVRNQIVFGSALYPAFAPDLDRELYRLVQHRFGLPFGTFLSRAAIALGPWVLGAAVIALPLAARRQERVAAAMLAFGLVAIVLAPLAPLADVRHVLPLLPWLALAAAIPLATALGRARPVADLVLLAAAALTLAHLPGLRARLDPPAELREAYRSVATHVRPGGRVLSLWTYDTAYHSGRPATWPIAWGQSDRPLAPFTTSDPAAFDTALARHGITAILTPIRSGREDFDGASYPRAFIECTANLVARGRLAVAWRSESLALLVRPS